MTTKDESEAGGPVRLRRFCSRTKRMSTTATSGGSQIFTINPYEDHPSLSPLEAEVLWEYAKLNQQIKDVRTPSPIPNTQETERMNTAGHPNTLCEQDARRDNVGKAQSFGTEDGLGLDVGRYFSLSCLDLGVYLYATVVQGFCLGRYERPIIFCKSTGRQCRRHVVNNSVACHFIQ
jgi:hypothetical protein